MRSWLGKVPSRLPMPQEVTKVNFKVPGWACAVLSSELSVPGDLRRRSMLQDAFRCGRKLKHLYFLLHHVFYLANCLDLFLMELITWFWSFSFLFPTGGSTWELPVSWGDERYRSGQDNSARVWSLKREGEDWRRHLVGCCGEGATEEEQHGIKE